MSGIQGVVRRTVSPVAVGLGVGTVAGSGAAVGRQSRMADSEQVGRTTTVRAARVMVLLADQTGQSVARPRTTVHRRYRTTRPRILVNHTVDCNETSTETSMSVFLIVGPK